MKKLIVCLIVLMFAGLASADALDDAKVVWQFADALDSAGPVFIDVTSYGGEHYYTTGIDVSGDGITAPNADGFAVQNTGYMWTDPPSGDPAYDDLWPAGSMTMFVRYKTSTFVTEEDIWGMVDSPCTYSLSHMYALEMVSGDPQFKVTGLGNTGSPDIISLGQTLSVDTWYDITGVFDAVAGTITIYVCSPITNEIIASNSMSVGYSALETGMGTEIVWWVSPCAARDEADSSALMELSVMWDRALDEAEIIELSGGSAGVGFVSETGDSTQVNEQGPTFDTFTVVLGLLAEFDDPIPPTQAVTVIVDPNVNPDDIDLGNGIGQSVTLTFTTANWDTPQTVTVTAVDDAIPEGPEESEILFRVTSGDLNYDEGYISPVTVAVTDNEAAGITVDDLGGVEVTEGSVATDEYTLVLASPPSAQVTINPGPAIHQRIAAGDDDAEEGAGVMGFGSSDYELPYDSEFQKVGLLFRNLNIPQGASITRAYLQFTTRNANAGPGEVHLLINGEKSPNAADFTSDANDITHRLLTTSQVQWSPPEWEIADESGEGQRTPDISAIVEEIVGQGGWSNDNSLVMIIEMDPGLTVGTAFRHAHSYNGSPSECALLHVEYAGMVHDQVVIDPTVLTFDSGNWNVPQTISVTAIDDEILEDNPHSTIIFHPASSGDSNYDGMEVSLDVTINENECGPWGYGPMDFTGPGGVPDCLVDVLDLAEFLTQWLDCSQPYQDDCDDLR